MPLTPGQILSNRYRIVKLLGQGGMGAVYKAWDLNLNRQRALKENLDVSPAAQRQFEREAQILSDLTHPNLPKVIDYFIVPGQGQYLVMEFVEGEDLEEKLQHAGRPLPESQALDWIEQACAALHYLHSQNPPIIHRDIKPANLKITSQGKAVLVDFGIAKVQDPKLSTTVGAKAVTPGYSPIEQYGSGQHTGPATDIYALGATLYTLLSGQTPPPAPDRDLGAVLASLRALNPAVTPGVEAAVQKAMAIQPQERFGSAAEFAAALRPAPPSPPARTPQALGARPSGYWRAGGLLLLALGVAYLLTAKAIGAWPFTAEEPTPPPTIEAIIITATESAPTTASPSPTATPSPTWTFTPTPSRTSTPTPSPSPTASATPTATLYPRVAIISFHGRYVIAQGEDDDWVLRQEADLDEKCGWFAQIRQDNGQVALFTCHDRYVTAPKTGGGIRWEWRLRQESDLSECGKFTIHDLGSGEVAFETCAGNYFTAGDGNWPAGLQWLVVAETNQLMDWERFKLLPP